MGRLNWMSSLSLVSVLMLMLILMLCTKEVVEVTDNLCFLLFFFFFPLFFLFLFFLFFQAEKISHEFLSQYQSEVELGLNPTNMWASLDTNFKLGMYDSQVKFIQFIVQPMWTIIVDLFPEFNSQGNLLGALNTNRTRWANMLQDEAELNGETKTS